MGQVADGRRGSCLKAVLQAVGSWVGEAHPTQLERQGLCQVPGDWVVLGGLILDDKDRLAFATSERACDSSKHPSMLL